MSADWAEIMLSLRQLLEGEAGGAAVDGVDTVWAQFRQLAAQSQHADQLQPLVKIIDYLDDLSQLEAMIALIQLVSPLEWPPEMNAAREHLTSALRALLHELKTYQNGTLASRLQPALDPRFSDIVTMVGIGQTLLSEPCQPAQIPHISSLCNTGLQSCLEMLRDALSATRPGEEINDARVAFLYAHSRYAEATRAFNRASGWRFFYDLSPPLSK